MNMMARPSQGRRKEVDNPGEYRKNAGMDIQRQLESPLQRSTHKNVNDMKKEKKLL
jgi:hypothetical protein